MLYIIYILLESALGEPDHYKYNVYKSKNKLKKVNHWSVRLVHIVRFFVFRKTENILGSLWTLILALKHDTMQFVIKKMQVKHLKNQYGIFLILTHWLYFSWSLKVIIVICKKNLIQCVSSWLHHRWPAVYVAVWRPCTDGWDSSASVWY